MSTGSTSDAEDIQELVVRSLEVQCVRSRRNDMTDELFDSAENSEDDFGTDKRFKEDKKKRGARIGSSEKQLLKAHKDGKQSQRNAANARERARMRVLSKAFSRLKTSLPWVPADTKLSKLDTLRLASSYISHLRQLLQEDNYESSFVHPVNLTWPFVVPGRSEDTKESPAPHRLCGTTT